MAEPQIFVDHLVGGRRGQRQAFRFGSVVRFGRHPDSDVCFDPHRDIDASSRHAELEPAAEGYLLRDVGSSNGTFVDGARVIERLVLADQPVEIEFGAGGPRVRLYVGDPERAPRLPRRAGTRMPVQTTRTRVVLGMSIGIVVTAALAIAAWAILV